MKKIKHVILIFLLVVLFMPFKQTQAKMINGWVINKYTTRIDVSETGLVHIWTKLDVYFDTPGHGIYVDIPIQYNMEWTQNGETTKKNYVFPVSNIQVENYPYDVDKQLSGIQIVIGDEDQYLSGDNSFIYSYDVQMRDLDLDGLQMFYWNIVGQGWTTYIEETQFTITLPTSQMNSTHFYPPTQLADTVDYSVDGRTINGSYLGTISPGNALTVLVDVPNDTFTFPPIPMTSYYVFGILIVFLVILLIFLYQKYGKDDPVVETVEFEAPKGISSAQAGYICSGEVNHKSITSLIIYWGSKGYLDIEILENETLNLKKLREIDDSEIEAERNLFNALFKKKEIVNTKKLGTAFGTQVQTSISTIPLTFKKGEQALFERKATQIKWTSIFIISLLFSFFMAFASYIYFPYALYSLIVFGIVLVFTVLLYVVTSSSTEFSKSKSTINKSASRIGKLVIVGFYTFALCLAAFFMKFDLVLFGIILFFMLLSIPFISYMTKRTVYGRDIYGKLLGLKRFIEVAEKDRLEALVNEDPSYFFNILPYAYALGVTSVWISKFEHIALTPPDWMGGYHPDLATYMYLNALNRSMNSLNTSVVQSIPEVKSGSGGGSFGGGGGGGFSGGGFGGGGGGRW